jgi:alcohol dehydrogenase class IV
MQANITALEARQPEHPALRRYAEVARILTGGESATGQDGVKWTRELVTRLKIPGLSTYGMGTAQFPEAVEKTLKASSFKGNPIALTEKELWGILEKSL